VPAQPVERLAPTRGAEEVVAVVEIVSMLVICTRNRPDDLTMALRWVAQSSSRPSVLVADASDPQVQEKIAGIVGGSSGCALLRCSPGLARQRNQALDWLRAERPDVEVVHFIDDDSQVSSHYFEEIERTFAADPELAGVGGVLTNHPTPRYVWLKQLFLLYSRVPGRVLSSGRSTMAHYADDIPERPDRLSGACMSYRLPLIEGVRFDDRLEGYSIGEDLFFSFAVSRRHPMAVAPRAAMVHNSSPVNRISKPELALERLRLVHRWVRENRDNGLRASHFWLSVVGEVLMRVLGGAAERNRLEMSEGMAIARAALVTLRSPLPTDGAQHA
jgi:GT2 family glycosyltransferase